MICVYLKPTEIANLRLVSRLAGPIGLEYMVPEVHLILAKNSFEQLKALAEHPIARKCVTSFFFEADKLGVLSREHWEQKVAAPEFVAYIKELRRQGCPCRHASERSLRTFNREVSKLSSMPRHHYTEQQMEHAFGLYSDFIHFQQDPQQIAIQETEMGEAMKRFPRLKELTMGTQLCGREYSGRLRKTFEPTLCDFPPTSTWRDNEPEPLGIQPMRSLLLGAHRAGLKAESLRCGVVSWRVLEQDCETFARMRDSVSNVKNLALEFAICGMEYEVEECAEYLRSGRLRDLVTAAPNLERLQIGFQYNEPIWATNLEYIVGEYHWPSLKTVDLKMIGTSEDDLVSFCSRHASTLKSLHLTSIGLAEGDWFSTFDRMRKVLTLDHMEVAGRLEGLPEDMDFEMDSEEYAPDLKAGIETYFLGPFLGDDELSLDDFLDQYLPNSDDSWSELDSDDSYWW